MADSSQQPTIGGSSSSQGQPPVGPELISWLARLTDTDPARIRTAVDARRLRTLARRDTDEELTTRLEESQTLFDNRLTGTEEQMALFESLDGFQQTQNDHLSEFERLATAEEQAFTDMSRQQDASFELLEQVEAQREALDGYEVELDRLFDTLEERWTEVGAALDAQGIAVGEAGETKDLDRLKALIAERRDALGRELDDLAGRTEEAQAEEQAARGRNTDAIAGLEALQREIEALGPPPEDPQDQGYAAEIARLRALEAERSEAVETSEEDLDRIGTKVAGLTTETEQVTRVIDALGNLADGRDSAISELQSIDDEFHLKMQESINANNKIEELEQEIRNTDEIIKVYERNIEDIKNKISQNQEKISDIESKILESRNKNDEIQQNQTTLDQQNAELDGKINQLMQTLERLDGEALRRAIQQLPESLQDDEITAAPTTTQPQETDVEGETAPSDLRETRQRMEQLLVDAEAAGAEGTDAAASASMLRATVDIGKIILRDAALLTTFATIREAASYGIAASSDKTQQDLAALLIGLNFLPVVVKVGGLVYDTSASRPEADRMAPTGKQYASLVTNTLMMIGATAAAAQKGGGVAAQAPAAARALIIGLRDMANLFMPVTQNRRGDLLLNMRAVLGDNLAYSVYSQLTTILIAQGLVHSGAGTQAAGLVGREAAKEVAKYVGAYTAVELMETISYRAFNQYFDRIAQGLEPAMPGDPNAHQGVQGLKRYRAKVGFKLKHTFAEVRRQGTDAAHARQAFTYIVLLLGNVVAELTKDLSVTNQTIALATTLFAATFAAYFPFVGLSEYAPPPARDGAGNE
ncbi:hypothetical protein AB4Z01_24720 [Inquilinus sp. YAF38]|uniref:hypothetical protein n=1 Tax=Inquilinus sp. YAF38 TaxID=3233084 RepID=UPI003F8F8397